MFCDLMKRDFSTTLFLFIRVKDDIESKHRRFENLLLILNYEIVFKFKKTKVNYIYTDVTILRVFRHRSKPKSHTILNLKVLCHEKISYYYTLTRHIWDIHYKHTRSTDSNKPGPSLMKFFTKTLHLFVFYYEDERMPWYLAFS